MFDSSKFIKAFLAKAQLINPKTFYDSAPYPITEEQASTLPHCVISAFRFTSDDDNVTEFTTTMDLWALDQEGQYVDIEAKCNAMREGLDNIVLKMDGAYATIYFDNQQPIKDPDIELLCLRLSFSGSIFSI